jgi:hypothetical protein
VYAFLVISCKSYIRRIIAYEYIALTTILGDLFTTTGRSCYFDLGLDNRHQTMDRPTAYRTTGEKRLLNSSEYDTTFTLATHTNCIAIEDGSMTFLTTRKNKRVMVRSEVRSYEVVVEKMAGAAFLRVLQFPLVTLIPSKAPYTSIDRGWYNRPNSGRRTK